MVKEDEGRSDKLTDDDYKEYWRADPKLRQERLRALYQNRDPADPYATSRDFNARELEIEAITRHIPPGKIVDLGCGNGYTLISVAARLGAGHQFVGIDFSESLIEGARTLLAKTAVVDSPEFVCDDAIKYVKALATDSCNGVITERFLLNMPDVATQHDVIREIYRALKPGGVFIMCEGSMEGFRKLNALRGAMGLDTIDETSADNLSAIRFEDAEIEQFVTRGMGFQLVEKLGFATYFAISRVLHPLLTAPEPPKFRSKINEWARQLQSNLPLSPGVGSNVVWVLRK
jgi:SAM-dependent methyltransferase